MARVLSSSRHPHDDDVHAVFLKRRWTVADAQVAVEAHRGSGLSLAAFARRHGLSLQRLYDWRRRLAVAPRFLPVTVKASPISLVPAVGTGLEIVLRGSRTVRVGPGCDERLLARVVEVLEGLPC